jgi:hypothetical protein
MYCLRHQAASGAFELQNAKTTIAHLPLTRLLNALVPDISVDEQRRSVRRLRDQLAAAESVRFAAEGQLKEIQRLPERTLATAFGEGERAA